MRHREHDDRDRFGPGGPEVHPAAAGSGAVAGTGPWGGAFARAATLARRGRYAEASEVLRTARRAGECSDVQLLDLAARIYAQQGLHLHAESCWRDAERRDPGNPAYIDGLRRLRLARRPSIARALLPALGWVVVIVLIGWQTAVVGPASQRRQDESERRLGAAIRSVREAGDAAAEALAERWRQDTTALGATVEARLQTAAAARRADSAAAQDRGRDLEVALATLSADVRRLTAESQHNAQAVAEALAASAPAQVTSADLAAIDASVRAQRRRLDVLSEAFGELTRALRDMTAALRHMPPGAPAEADMSEGGPR